MARKKPTRDVAFDATRESGELLCQCHGQLLRDPEFPYQCRICKRRIHRWRDQFIPQDMERVDAASRDRFHAALRRAHARINPPEPEEDS